MITMNTKPPIPPNGSFYPPTLLNSFPRIPLPPTSNDSMFSSPPAFLPGQAFVQGDHNSAFYPTGNVMMSSSQGNQHSLPWRNFPGWTFDQLAVYPYGTGYSSLDVRRKNATRESTSTLKAWLYEHIKNPYPTKAEKIMLAIITKMTLTQVSTWFANARRRLKKENKMQWSPRNRTGDDDDDDDKNSDNDDMGESDTSRHNRVMDDDLLDDEGDIIVDGGIDEPPPHTLTSANSNPTKPYLDGAEEASRGNPPSRDETTKTPKTNITNHIHQLHPKFHHQNSPQLFFDLQNHGRHPPFSPFHPSLRSFSSLQQSFSFINKTFMPRFKASEEPHAHPSNTTADVSRSPNSTDAMQGRRASTPTKVQSNDSNDEVNKKSSKPRIWCLADVATSGNKNKENNNSNSSNNSNNNNNNYDDDDDGRTDPTASAPTSSGYKVHPLASMRQASIHQALVQFYHPYFNSHLTPPRLRDRTSLKAENTSAGNCFSRSPVKSVDDKTSRKDSTNGTFQPWLNLNEKLHQEWRNHVSRDSSSGHVMSSYHPPRSHVMALHRTTDEIKPYNSRSIKEMPSSPNDTSLNQCKSSPSPSSPSSNGSIPAVAHTRHRVTVDTSPSSSPLGSTTPSPPSSSSSSSSSSTSSLSISSSSAPSSNPSSSSLLFQTAAHLPLSCDVIISAPQSPLVYRKHSPSRDSTFEYWPSSRQADK